MIKAADVEAAVPVASHERLNERVCDECGTRLVESDADWVCPACGLVAERRMVQEFHVGRRTELGICPKPIYVFPYASVFENRLTNINNVSPFVRRFFKVVRRMHRVLAANQIELSYSEKQRMLFVIFHSLRKHEFKEYTDSKVCVLMCYASARLTGQLYKHIQQRDRKIIYERRSRA